MDAMKNLRRDRPLAQQHPAPGHSDICIGIHASDGLVTPYSMPEKYIVAVQ